VSEFRLDPLTREWVAIAGGRQGRPNRPQGVCPFCVGGIEALEPYVVKAFANRWPMYVPGSPIELVGDHVEGRGASEVVLYAPDHDASLGSLGRAAIRRVIDLWAERTEALLARAEIEYVLVFENRGEFAGATIAHPHGQIYAFPFVPPIPAREEQVAEAYGCPFCRAPNPDLMVWQGERWTAFVPFASAHPFGLLVVPDRHVGGLPELGESERDGLAAALEDVLLRYDRLFDEPLPYMLWIHHGGHVHVHLAPPFRAAGTMRWIAAGELGSGTLTNPVSPEAAAAALRDA
jgi:UDPglucose--hexose-1-phosphate uridylyltransferase